MHNGFKKLVIGTTAATLLSGTAFSLGPTISDPPTLIITDRLKEEVINNGGNTFDDLTANGTNSESYNNYIFTEAFDLDSVISVPAGATLADVNWDFVELDGSDMVLGSGLSIDINGTSALTAAPDFTALTTAARQANVGSTDPLTFTNTVQSINTEQSIASVAAFTDTARVELYAATVGDPTQTVATATFDIITTNDPSLATEGDRFSAPTSIFTPVEGFDDLGGWNNVFALNLGPIFSTAPIGLSAANDVAPNSVPAVSSLISDTGLDSVARNFLPPNVDTLQIFTNADTTAQTVVNAFGPGNGNLENYGPELIGYGSFLDGHPTLASSATVAADSLYMIRWNLSSPNTPAVSTQLPLVQLLVGATDGGGIGRSSLEFGDNSFNNLVTPQGDSAGTAFDVRQYFYAHGSGELGFFLNLFDTAVTTSPTFPDGHIGHDVTINRVDVFEVNTGSLTGETVVFNQGAASVALASGQTAPSAVGVEDFDLDLWAGRDQLAFIADAHGASGERNSSLSPDNPIVGPGLTVAATNATATALSFTHGTGNGPTFIQWDTFNSLNTITGDPDPVRANPREVLELTEGDLVFMDYYLSATGSKTTLPFTRVGVQSDNIPVGGLPSLNSVSGLVGFMQMEPRPGGLPRTDNTTATPSVPFDSTGSRLLRFVFEVQLTSTTGIDSAAPNYAARPTFQSFVIPGGVFESGAQGTVNLNRVVVTTYDPVTGADISMPLGLTDID